MAASASGFFVLTLWSSTQLLGHESGTWRSTGQTGAGTVSTVWHEIQASRDLVLPAASRRVVCTRHRYHWRVDCPLTHYTSARLAASDVRISTRGEAVARHLQPCAYCARLDVAEQLRVDP